MAYRAEKYDVDYKTQIWTACEAPKSPGAEPSLPIAVSLVTVETFFDMASPEWTACRKILKELRLSGNAHFRTERTDFFLLLAAEGKK
jgi:hypothetical protein